MRNFGKQSSLSNNFEFKFYTLMIQNARTYKTMPSLEPITLLVTMITQYSVLFRYFRFCFRCLDKYEGIRGSDVLKNFGLYKVFNPFTSALFTMAINRKKIDKKLSSLNCFSTANSLFSPLDYTLTRIKDQTKVLFIQSGRKLFFFYLFRPVHIKSKGLERERKTVTYVFIISRQTSRYLKRWKKIFSHEGCRERVLSIKNVLWIISLQALLLNLSVINNFTLVALAVFEFRYKLSLTRNADVTLLCTHMTNLAKWQIIFLLVS